MAQPTMQDAIDLARETLNDDDKDRYADVELLKYGNDGLDDVLALRPDLFIGSFIATSDGHQLDLTDPLPIEGRFKRNLADYIIFRAESKDDEHVNSGRMAAIGKFFQDRLTG